MIFGGVVGATAFAGSSLTPALAALTAASPSPTFKSNESAAHEAGESAAQEAAENNGTAHFGGGRPCGGHSNEDAAHGSPFSLVGIQLAYNLGSPRTQISFHGGANYTYYWDHLQGLQDYDISVSGGLSIQHRASPRLTLTADLSAAYLTEPLFSDNIGIARRSGNFFYAQDQVSAAYLWAPRFQTVTSYTFFALAYDDNEPPRFRRRSWLRRQASASSKTASNTRLETNSSSFGIPKQPSSRNTV